MAARGLIRNNGINKKRMNDYFIDLDTAVEAVKYFDERMG